MSRLFKDGARLSVSDVFRIQVINQHSRSSNGSTSAKDVRSPVLTLGSTSFLYIREGTLWIVAVTRSNQDASVILEFLFSYVALLKHLFQKNNSPVLAESNIVDNFCTIYEMLGEMLEFGIPTNMELSALSSTVSGLSSSSLSLSDIKSTAALTKSAFGAKSSPHNGLDSLYDAQTVSWRESGIKYRRNEIFLNVDEKLHVLLDNKGELVRSYIDGAISMKAHLSGMPVCRFGFADDRFHDQMLNTISLDDFKFHKCVDLAKYDSEQVIRFVPPDGNFQLMTYHIANSTNVPFKVIPRISDSGDRVSVSVTMRSLFDLRQVATAVCLKVPTPRGTTKSHVSCSNGKAKFSPQENCIVWKFAKFYGGHEYHLDVDLALEDADEFDHFKSHSLAKLPLSLDFTMEMFSASGLLVKFLKVVEKSNYKTVKWIKYTTQAGSYDIRV